MSAEAVECPWDSEPEINLLDEADRLSEENPGWRVEIIGGNLTMAPSPDSRHARVLTDLMVPFIMAGLHGKETLVLQNVDIALPGGPSDYATPDLVVVDADIEDHVTEKNCHDAAIVHLAVEVTSSNYNHDLRTKVNAYAEAGIPVYLIINRKHGRVHLLTAPNGDTYESHQVYAPGQSLTLPAFVGPEGAPAVTL
ncbi:Uma2 family endonuclease, partial [Streptomyces clavuligerus]